MPPLAVLHDLDQASVDGAFAPAVGLSLDLGARHRVAAGATQRRQDLVEHPSLEAGDELVDLGGELGRGAALNDGAVQAPGLEMIATS